MCTVCQIRHDGYADPHERARAIFSAFADCARARGHLRFSMWVEKVLKKAVLTFGRRSPNTVPRWVFWNMPTNKTAPMFVVASELLNLRDANRLGTLSRY